MQSMSNFLLSVDKHISPRIAMLNIEVKGSELNHKSHNEKGRRIIDKYNNYIIIISMIS